MSANSDFGTWGRYKEIPLDEMTPDQKRIYQFTMKERGQVPGPYKIWLHSPILMQRLERLGTFLVKESSLTPREQELAILVVSQHWHGKFVFTVHSRVAREAGIPDTVIADIAAGKLPKLDDPREAAVVEIAMTAEEAEPASDATFGRAVTALGDTIADAQKRAYQAIEKIHFEGMYYRKDIGKRAIG